MRFKFLNNTLQNRRFDYNPMYYDERREFFKENMRTEWSRTEIRQAHTRSANLRTVLLICLILGLGYFIFYGLEDVDSIVKKIW